MISEIGDLAPLLFALLLLPGACILLVRSAASGTTGRTGTVGIRTRHTTASDDAWTTGHSAALPVVIRTLPVGSVGVVTAVALQILAGGYTGTAVAVVALLGEVVLLVRAVRAADRAARWVTTGD